MCSASLIRYSWHVLSRIVFMRHRPFSANRKYRPVWKRHMLTTTVIFHKVFTIGINIDNTIHFSSYHLNIGIVSDEQIHENQSHSLPSLLLLQTTTSMSTHHPMENIWLDHSILHRSQLCHDDHRTSFDRSTEYGRLSLERHMDWIDWWHIVGTTSVELFKLCVHSDLCHRNDSSCIIEWSLVGSWCLSSYWMECDGWSAGDDFDRWFEYDDAWESRFRCNNESIQHVASVSFVTNIATITRLSSNRCEEVNVNVVLL